jgi:hypothetical protein
MQPNSVAIPYCQKDPSNRELIGFYQCQYESANQGVFAVLNSSDPNVTLKLGENGTLPFNFKHPITPLGSCIAHPQGPLPDSTQLIDFTQIPRPDGSGGH